MPPKPKPKPQPPSRLSNLGYGLGDVEFLADLYPYIKNDPVARLGLSGYDRGETSGGLADLIDTDPLHKSPYAGTNVRGAYNRATDQIYVGTTDLDPAKLPLYVKYFSGPTTTAHELRHRGMQNLYGDAVPSPQKQEDLFQTYDREMNRDVFGFTPSTWAELPDDEKKFLIYNLLFDAGDFGTLRHRRRHQKLDDIDNEAKIELQRRGVPPQTVAKPQTLVDKVLGLLNLID